MTEEAIFIAALEKKSPGERNAFLDRACAGNVELRSAVEGLLKASTDAGSFLEHPPLPLDATIVSTGVSRDTAGAAEWTARLSFLKPCDKPDRLGKLVSKAGEYEIIEVVGHGGMGAVLRAFDTKLSRVVAVKVMAPELAANPVAVRRFLREATTAAAVHHEHVVTIHAVDDSHQPPYLVMQFVEGQTLQDKVDREGPLELKQILRIGSQAAAGLAAAHKTGLIHRDVKPSNILLENGVERVKISDFGLARAADDVQMTQTGIISGTPQYMSPEQAKGEPVDARGDLFSLGSVLYTMCTGRPAFRADNPIAVLRRVCDDTPRPIRETNPEIPEWLCEIVEKLMDKEPASRFQSAQDVADLLAAHLAHLQQPANWPLPPRVTNRPSRAATANEVIANEARWFWASGIMSVVAAGLVLGAFQKLSTALPTPLAIWLIGGGLLSLPIGLTIMYAAWQVESRQSPTWAWTAALLSLLPINPFLLFCLPISIWSLVTVRKAHQEGQFATKQPLKLSPPPSAWPPPVWLWSSGLFLAVVGMLVFFLIVAFSLRSAPVVATLVGLGFFWVTAMCCWSFATIFHQARFGGGSIASICLSGAGLMLAIVVMFFGFLKTALGYDTRSIAPYFVGLMLALVVAMAAWFVSALRAAPPAPPHKPSGEKPRHPAKRGVFIEHPVLGVLAIFLLIVAASVGTYMLTATANRSKDTATLSGAGATPVLPSSAPASEWIHLFNGKDLTGWKAPPNQLAFWKVEGGELVGTGAPSHLFSERGDYQDFHLRVEAQINDGGSSGVYFRVPEFAATRYGQFPDGYEANINSTGADDTDKTGSLTGSLRGVAPFKDALHKPDEWFTLEVRVQGQRIVIQVNGKTTVDFVDANHSFRHGHLALQVWPAESVVRFRKIEIKELRTGASSVPPNPPLAVAPFDAQQARAHQETWANHLGVPVEFTNSIGMPLRLIPPGRNPSDSSGESQSKDPFFLGTCEVTVGQFRRFFEETSHQTTGEKNSLGGSRVQSKKKTERRPEYVWSHPEFAASADHPVTQVTWHDAMAFCEWLSRKEGRTYCLPTGGEWQWAVQAGCAKGFYFGEASSDADAHAWHQGNANDRTQPVRSKLPNPWGLYDVYGNVWEISYNFERNGTSIYPAGANEGPTAPDRINFWGGSINGPPEAPPIRGFGPALVPYSHLGFRVAIVGDLKTKTQEIEKTQTSPQPAVPSQTRPEND